MTGFRFLFGLALVPVLGWPFARTGARVSRQSARAAAAPIGALLVGCEMALLSLLEIRWNLALLLAPGAAAWAAFLRRSGSPEPVSPRSRGAGWPGVAALCAGALGLVLAAYAAGSARATSTDLLLFWGPKAQRFASVRTLDAAFLGASEHYYMHPDYPPLVTLLEAWSCLWAGRFAWGATLLTLPLCLTGSAAVFFDVARGRLGERGAAEWTALLVLLDGLALTVSMTAGGAEPFLLFFEVVVLACLVLGEDESGRPAAAFAAAAAALCKVEGLVFALLVALVFGAAQRPWRRALHQTAWLALPALSVTGAWVLFCARRGLLDTYRGGGPLHLEYLGTVLQKLPGTGLYESGYLPWLVVLAPIGLGIRRRLDWRPALVALGFLGFSVYLYLHMSVEPTQWIAWSGSRVLLTPLNALFFTAASAGRRGSGGEVRSEAD